MTNIFATAPALGAPSPIFEAILDELPTSTFTVRLPAVVPTDVELYPVIQQTRPDILVLNVDTTPECAATRCIGFNIITIPKPNAWPAPENRLTPITPVILGSSGIQAYTSEARGLASVEWMQDGSLYMLIYNTDLLSAEDAISMANSMTTEPPVSQAP
ncbi:MAG: hypothetical protein ACFB2W_08025 [Leptolyngbyaceae cyanobacterium]